MTPTEIDKALKPYTRQHFSLIVQRDIMDLALTWPEDRYRKFLRDLKFAKRKQIEYLMRRVEAVREYDAKRARETLQEYQQARARQIHK